MSETSTPTETEVAEAESLLAEVRGSAVERLLLQDEIGSGGTATVNLAEDQGLHRLQAVKTIHHRLRDHPHSIRRFVREARITARLEHPNVVPVHDIGLDSQGRLFFTMKLVQGTNLRDMIRELPPGPIEHDRLLNLVDVVIKVCNALAFAHSRGVVHRDVKPANVMVGDFGEVYLVDWGVARLLESEDAGSGTTGSGRPMFAVIGTPPYMSPEQALGDEAHTDQRSDVFLVGALLYEMLTRQPPFRDSNMIASLMRASVCSFTPPELVAGDAAIPTGLRKIVMKAMASEPAHRYQSIVELREDLVRFARGGGRFKRVDFETDAVIIAEGDEGDAAYFIVSGRCRVTVGENGKRQVLRDMGPGDAFGETAILSPGRRTATVTALEPTTVEVVTRAQFADELELMRPWMARFIRTLADRFREREHE